MGVEDKKGIFYGWWVIVALFLVSFFGPMARFSLTAFFPFIEKEMGWSRTIIGMASAIHFWVYAVAAIIAGRMVDTIGGRKTIFLGGLIILVGMGLLSNSGSLWLFYIIFGVVIAFGVAMTHTVPNNSITRKWFIKKAGLATGVVTVGFTLGMGVLVPVLGSISNNFGWRLACLIAGLTFGIIIMLLAVLVVRSTPESMGLQPDGIAPASKNNSHGESNEVPVATEVSWTSREAFGTRSFWGLLGAFALIGIPIQGLFAHLVMWGIDVGASPVTAGLFVTAFTVPALPIRIFGGWLGDKFGKRKLLILAYASCTAVWIVGWLTIGSSQSLVIFVIVLGLASGPTMAVFTPYVGDLFGRASVGTLMGVLTMSHGIVGALGPIIWGRISEMTGNYNQACLISAICYGMATVAVILTRVEKKKELAFR